MAKKSRTDMIMENLSASIKPLVEDVDDSDASVEAPAIRNQHIATTEEQQVPSSEPPVRKKAGRKPLEEKKDGLKVYVPQKIRQDLRYICYLNPKMNLSEHVSEALRRYLEEEIPKYAE